MVQAAGLKADKDPFGQALLVKDIDSHGADKQLLVKDFQSDIGGSALHVIKGGAPCHGDKFGVEFSCNMVCADLNGKPARCHLQP